MFVSIIFDTEYFGMGERHKWFLKNLSHAKQNDCLVITHEFLKKHYEEYADHCMPRFYQEFEMKRLSQDEYTAVSKGFVADKIFDDLEEQFTSRTEMLSYLLQHRYEPLETELIRLIDQELLQKKKTKIDAIFNCLDTFASIHYLGEKYHCPIISYSFSAIRKMHGYRQTLYMASLDGIIRQSKEIEKRYQNYKMGKQVPVLFSNRELLAIFGKEKNIPLLKIMDYEPEHELGICKIANTIYPYDYLKYPYTDTDLYYEARKKLKTTDIVIRDHPGIPWNGNDKGPKKEHERNDPVSFILSCKRVTSIDSQILLKALLWKRTIFVKGGISSFEFMSGKDIRNTEKTEIDKLNYYIFGYLIPAEFMFSMEYWKWRVYENPPEYDIYMKHLHYYMNLFGYRKELLFALEEKNRLQYILELRNTNRRLIDYLLREEPIFHINYEVLYSKIVLKQSENVIEEITCVNKVLNDIVQSKFVFDCEEVIDEVIFYPFVDVGGFAQIDNCSMDNKKINSDEKILYIKKISGGIKLDIGVFSLGEHSIIINWKYYFE